jgi:type 2 lantibiotic biosynthesis protein LanM
MDLKKLAWFFEDEVEQCQRAFIARIARPDAQEWLSAFNNNLLHTLFGATHKVLVAQYKMIESQVGFDDFSDSLRRPEIRDYLYGRYPLLRRSMANTCSAWLEQACAVVERYTQDAEAIRTHLLRGDSTPKIKYVRFGMGDYHRGGRSVAILGFEDGRRLVYKPRSLAIDTHFEQILDWVNRRCGTDLWVPAHLDSGAYGWVEFVQHTECNDAQQIERFYSRIGSLLALLYLLEGNDFHYENIIAVGEHPVLIDLESFFCPPLDGDGSETLDTSVLRVGLLPNRLAASGNMPEISGLSDAEGQLSLEGLYLVRQEDDSVALIRSRGVMLGSHNVPVLNGARIELQAEYALQLKQGFERVYRAVLDNTEAFAALVEACANDEIRVLFRHTATYSHLLEEARHPSLMASESATADHYGLLRMGISEYALAERFVAFEIADLERGDVPMFTAAADGLDLRYAEDRCISGFFSRSGLDMVRRNLAKLSQQDLDRQLWIIGNSFIAHSTRATAQGRARSQLSESGPDETALDTRLIAQASAIAERMREQMHITDDSASWLVHLNSTLDNSQFDLIPAFYDIYGGMPGEILFYSQLAQVTGDFEQMNLAQKALNHLKQRLLESGSAIQAVGLYVGWGSVVRLMTSLAELQSRYAHLEYVETLLADPRFEEMIEKDRNFSLIKGAAGFMLACSELHISSGSKRALALAEACARHLLSHRWPETDAHAWRVTSAVPLSGLAHGASGFAMAFAGLYEATGNPAYRDISLSALEYERTLFVPESGNWQDRRDYVVKEYGDRAWCSVAWAHGAPGIGLARLALLRAGIDTPQIREELEIAVRATMANGFDDNDSLIFGNFGNLEFLTCYHECFGQDALPELPAIVSRLLGRVENQGFRLSAPAPFPIGMLAGATGIAYQCLRLARMHQVPSVLCGTSRLSSVAGTDAQLRVKLRGESSSAVLASG